MRKGHWTFDRSALAACVLVPLGVGIVWATAGGAMALAFGIGGLVGSFRLNGL